MTEFRKLAENLAESNLNKWKWFKPCKATIYCDKYFTVTLKQSFEWNQLPNKDRNNLRILILLFAEQHYLQYKKIDDDKR